MSHSLHSCASALCASLLCSSALPASSSVPFLPSERHPAPSQVLYMVMTDRFANGDTTNDRGGLTGGPDDHGFDPSRISHYHGGDFRGLIGKLDYLKGLGITAVWVTPPNKNKPYQPNSAGYHGYWPTDFLNVDPHLGTNEDFKAFVDQAHARGMRVILDVVVNHTADVIAPSNGNTRYVSEAEAPWRDASGKIFDEQAVAYNGLGDPAAFPALSLDHSFPVKPTVPAAEAQSKHPAWLNDLTLYHNRGNTTFQGENSLHGDFVGLDDLFTEHPKVVQGMIEIFSSWIRNYNVDGFRLDTARHVNPAFWEAFCPAMHAEAAKIGKRDFLLFGEVYNEAGDARVLSDYSTVVPIDTTVDFGFMAAAREFVSKGGPSDRLMEFFADDDYYIDHDSNAYVSPTFLGNHDAGRFGYFLKQDNARATDDELLNLMKLGHALMFFARGQPVIYYGDEQGMVGTGPDMGARETMFPSHAPEYRQLALIGTPKKGGDDKFDPAHPLYQFFGALSQVRRAHPALSSGALLPRETGNVKVAAFSRVDRAQRVEYLVALNTSREASQDLIVDTLQRPGARMALVYASRSDVQRELVADAAGSVRATLGPLQYAVWAAQEPVAATNRPFSVKVDRPINDQLLTFANTEIDGQRFPTRQRFEVSLDGGDGLGEVTFLLRRSTRPGQFDYLGTDDTPPYRVFWRPPADMRADETLELHVVASDVRGRFATAAVTGLRVSLEDVRLGFTGAKTPTLQKPLPKVIEVKAGTPLTVSTGLDAVPAAQVQWFKDGVAIPGAETTTLNSPAAQKADAGTYVLRARNAAGTSVSEGTQVIVMP
jgi:alpha-amylase